MKYFIPSKGRATVISTHKVFSELNYTLVLHNKQEQQEYLKNATIDPQRIVVADVPYGIVNIRNFILDNLLKEDEWACFMDDNIHSFSAWTSKYYQLPQISKYVLLHKNLDKEANAKIDYKRFEEIIQETIVQADKYHIRFCGFATTDNYLFRNKKWSYVGYVTTKTALVKKIEGLRFDVNLLAMDDYGFTAQNLLLFGKVLINKYMYPVAGHYQIGGIGTYKERLPKKLHDCAYLINTYPNLFRYNKKKDGHSKAEVIMRLTSLKQVEQWRQQMI